MRNRRWAIIAGLGVVELWILGLIVRSIAGGHSAGVMPGAAMSAPQPAGAMRTFQVGAAPSVVIDDEDALVNVTVRSGTTVLVDERVAHGWSHTQALSVEQTADGVRISQASGGLGLMFGSPARRLDVVVPPQARLEVVNAGSTTLTGLRADARVHSDDGSVTVTDHRGELVVTTDNGRIELHDVIAAAVEAATDNGRISLDRVRADKVSVRSDSGRVEVSDSLLRAGKISTDDGRVELGLQAQSDVTVNAQTASGRVSAQAPLTIATAAGDDAEAPRTIRVGDGAGSLEVHSDSGSIDVRSAGSM